ncbi:uncharacterized protein FSUBG_6859 [Fusarium subglutinans]|uniref:Uncharacterized protein n=1 Tax=Gibberella subglutinans TaxID=42677 RepID=A0A8H5PWJ9_GIBSU|nr:uncharacterized protein FSUBG_6859 [Fusarium subglutinans]KAF5604556.1 hypothetical protein FSUBG_6859 [Fusarium subglutinans]
MADIDDSTRPSDMSDRRPKRAATSAPQDEPPSKRPDVDEEDDSPSEEALEHAKHLFDRRRPVTKSTAAEIVRRITQPTPEGWSDDDEAVISGYWDASPAKTHSAKINQGQHAALLTLFKTSIRVVGLAPITMISPIHSLRYQPVSRDNSGIESIYSDTFCILLPALIVHPGFGRNKHHIIWAMQYAVACRLDDRRAWPHEQYSGYCPALELVSQRIGNSLAPEPIHAMHKSAREEVVAQGRDPTQWSDFLYHVGETVASHGSPRPPVVEEFRENLGFDVLPVTLWDLQALEKAVDTMEWPEEDMRYPVSEAWKAWKIVKQGRDAPAIRQLPELFELLHKDIYRQTYSPSSPVPSSDQDESVDVNPQPPSPEDENPTDEIGTGNDHAENVFDSSEHSCLEEGAGSGEDMMATDDVAPEAGFPAALPPALQSSLETQMNKRLNDFMKQQREITAEQERKITDLQSKVDDLGVQLADKQRQIDLLSTARRETDSKVGKLLDDQFSAHVNFHFKSRRDSLLQQRVAVLEHRLGIPQSHELSNRQNMGLVVSTVPEQPTAIPSTTQHTSLEQHPEFAISATTVKDAEGANNELVPRGAWWQSAD